MFQRLSDDANTRSHTQQAPSRRVVHRRALVCRSSPAAGCSVPLFRRRRCDGRWPHTPRTLDSNTRIRSSYRTTERIMQTIAVCLVKRVNAKRSRRIWTKCCCHYYYYYRATLCVSAVFAVGQCSSVCLSVCHVRVLYPDG